MSWTGGSALGTGVLVVVVAEACAAAEPDWVETFSYAPDEVHAIEIRGPFGFPRVPVRIGGETLLLPFDTGNTVGLALAPEHFEAVGLEASGVIVRRDSSGQVAGESRIAEGKQEVFLFGRSVGTPAIHEISLPKIPGLVGPEVVSGGRFTLDYATARMAIGRSTPLQGIPGYQSVPLVRSERHPALILVRGSVGGRDVLIEIDTGKSRSVIHPDLSRELGLARVQRGVRVPDVRIGRCTFDVPCAKEVDQSGIDTGGNGPILFGVGSDVLCRFPFTVDYGTGKLWLPES